MFSDQGFFLCLQKNVLDSLLLLFLSTNNLVKINQQHHSEQTLNIGHSFNATATGG